MKSVSLWNIQYLSVLLTVSDDSLFNETKLTYDVMQCSTIFYSRLVGNVKKKKGKNMHKTSRKVRRLIPLLG